MTTDRITAITPMRIRTITIIMGTGTNGRMIPGAMHRMNPGWKVITRVTMIPTAMTAVRNMIIFRIPLTTVPYEDSSDNDSDWDDDSWDSGWDSNDSWDSGYDDWGSDW